MSKAHAFGLHYPIDHRAALLTAKAVPEILRRRHYKARLRVRMSSERTTTNQIRALALQQHPARFHQSLQSDLPLQSFDLCFRYPRHQVSRFAAVLEKAVKCYLRLLT